MPSVEPSQNSFPTNLWIFGYGSVIWNHSEIPHLEAIPAYIKGYKRRFWQGSPDHRGTPALPGRVVSLYTPSNLDALNLTALDSSLYPSENAWDVHGLALRVTPSHAEKVIASLDEREKAGYEHIWLPLYTTDAATGGEKVLQVKALVYIATPSNTSFLGYETHSTIARHIAHAKGPSGKNIDYLTSLQAALHGISRPDEHVDALVAALSL